MIPARAGPGRSIRNAAGGGRKNSSLEDVDRLDEFNYINGMQKVQPP